MKALLVDRVLANDVAANRGGQAFGCSGLCGLSSTCTCMHGCFWSSLTSFAHAAELAQRAMEQATPHRQLDAAIRLYVLRKKAQVQQLALLPLTVSCWFTLSCSSASTGCHAVV